MTGTGLVALLWRFRVRLLVTGLIVAIGALGVSRIMAETFGSEGTLIIENLPSAGADSTSPAALSNAATQVDVLKSRGLIEDVVRKLDLVNVPTVQPVSRLPKVAQDFLATIGDEIKKFKNMISGDPPGSQTQFDAVTQYVQKHLAVTNEENSNLITIGYLGGSPKTVADVVNGIMDAYLAKMTKAHDDKVIKTETWIAKQKREDEEAIALAEQRVNEYARTHNVAEVQGSQTTAMQLSETQKELVLARTKLANAQAAYATAKNGGSGAQEILDSKTIVALKTQEAKLIGDLGTLTSIDPRRSTIQGAIAATRAQIASETAAIMTSLARDVEVSKANVAAVEVQTRSDTAQAQTGSAASSEFTHLKDALTNERTLYASFLTQATAARVAAQQAPTARILFAAFEPERPAYAYGIMSLILGFMGGVMGQSGYIVLRSMMRPMVNSREDMFATTGLLVFGSLPRVKSRGENILAAPKTAPQVTETIRALGISMVAIAPDADKGVVILVTSSETQEGKTTIASFMAQRFASDGSKVLLIDGDLRNPGLAARFKTVPRDGLEALLQRDSNTRMEDAIGHVSPHLHVLCSAGRVKNPMRAVISEAFGTIIAISRSRYDYIIIDSPPLLHVADAALLARYAQRIVFIVQSGRLTQDVVSEATSRFDEDARSKIVTMMNRVPPKLMHKTDYYGGYARRAS